MAVAPGNPVIFWMSRRRRETESGKIYKWVAEVCLVIWHQSAVFCEDVISVSAVDEYV